MQESAGKCKEIVRNGEELQRSARNMHWECKRNASTGSVGKCKEMQEMQGDARRMQGSVIT
jgi:hypothetical protein